MTGNQPDRQPVFSPTSLAVIAWLPRCGVSSFQIRFSEEQPVAWTAVAELPDGRFDAAAGNNPDIAVIRLAETLVDGGQCRHCNRPTGFEPNWEIVWDDGVLPICWATYDPETDSIRPGCGRDRSKA